MLILHNDTYKYVLCFSKVSSVFNKSLAKGVCICMYYMYQYILYLLFVRRTDFFLILYYIIILFYYYIIILLIKLKKEDGKMENKLFNDGEYIVWAEHINDLKVGDKIYLTTSEFEYDCMCGCFMKDIYRCAKVKVKILHEDLSEYVQGKHLNGGWYGFATAEVLEILEVGY